METLYASKSSAKTTSWQRLLRNTDAAPLKKIFHSHGPYTVPWYTVSFIDTSAEDSPATTTRAFRNGGQLATAPMNDWVFVLFFFRLFDRVALYQMHLKTPEQQRPTLRPLANHNCISGTTLRRVRKLTVPKKSVINEARKAQLANNSLHELGHLRRYLQVSVVVGSKHDSVLYRGKPSGNSTCSATVLP